MNNFSPSPDTHASSEQFWEAKYAAMTSPASGAPSAVLQRFAYKRAPGCALDLGCARGDDAIWLARQGWQVTGADISSTALDLARASASTAGVAGQTSFLRCDLGEAFPEGQYDLVCATFLHSPVQFDRINVLRRASRSVASGGLLLIASHGSRLPWSWSPVDTVFQSSEDALAELDLPPHDWQRIFVGPVTREARGPDGKTATAIDNIIAIERR